MATVTQKPSPNYSQGRGGKMVDRIVIHWIVGNLASADAQFAKDSSDVSAHYAIENNQIHQYVKESDTAWHAGNGAMNQRSIGIEHSAAPDRPASAQTIETSAQLVYEIAKRYNIPLDRQHIIKHSEVPYATQCSGTIPIDTIIKKAKEKEQLMVDRNLLFVLFRFYLGRAPDDGAIKAYVGKPLDTVLNAIKTSTEFKGKIAAGKVGKLDAKNHLPTEIRTSYIPPTASTYTAVTEILYRKV